MKVFMGVGPFQEKTPIVLYHYIINTCGAPEVRDDPEDKITALLNVTEDPSF